MAVKYSLSTLDIRPGGTRSQNVVNPRRSAITTDTLRMSPWNAAYPLETGAAATGSERDIA